MQLYKAVKDLRIADVELTGSWEKSLADIECGAMSAETFMKTIEVYTRQITEEVLSLDVKQPHADAVECPKCHRGNMTIRHKIAKCGNDKCGLVVASIREKYLTRFAGERNLNGDQLMEMLNISRRTLQDYRDRGIIPYTSIGGKFLYKVE